MATQRSSEELFVRLYLDENVFKDVAQALRLRGFDALSVHEIGKQGLSDAEQLVYAIRENRTLFTFK